MPAALKRQLPAESTDKLVINRGFEKCLVIYPLTEWKKETARVGQLNNYDKESREFLRYFFRGATELTLDTANRFLLPKYLMEYAEVVKEATLFAYLNKIELWSKHLYHPQMDEEPKDFSAIAERVMGSKKE